MSLRRVVLALWLTLSLTLGVFAGSASAASTSVAVNGPFSASLLAKAQPDECFYGIGSDLSPGLPCAEDQGGQPKVNQAYVWGLTQAGSTLWFGTAPNVVCMVIGGYLGSTDPLQTDSYVCEFGQSQVARMYNLPAAIGDWRPPKIYTYDTLAGKKTPALTDKSALAGPRLQTTVGLRSAGSLNGVVFLAGPSLLGGVNMFAFNASTGGFIGSQNFTAYDNIRKWIVDQGVLYTAVHNVGGGSSVLRWTGSVDSPFSFETVGSIYGDGAELVVHQGRVFVSTWPDTTSLAGLWMSPTIPSGGLTAAEASGWTKVWSVSQYEPDPVTAATYGGGALASFGGYLYWGTMHVPLTSALANAQAYPRTMDTAETALTILNTYRAISIFRGQNFDSGTPQVELLYGESTLPVYTNYDPVTQTGEWALEPNKTGAPLYGSSGFGNVFNNYTWTMSVYQNQLFVGTMDWSYLLPDLGPVLGIPVEDILPKDALNPGADLWRFPDVNSPATAVSTDGMGNPTSYGIRTMLVSQDANTLYLGMANPMNLLTLKGQPYHGGWELLQLQAKKLK